MTVRKLLAVVVFLTCTFTAFASVYPAVDAVSGNTCTTGWYGACRDGCTRLHQGIDISNGYVHDAIGASAPGAVSYAGYNGGYGNMVQVDHWNRYSTVYAHMYSLSVSYGNWVGNGTTLGLKGTTGNSTGEHLHWEVRFDNVQQPVWPDYNPGTCVGHTKGQNHPMNFFNWYWPWWGHMKFGNLLAWKNLDNAGGSMDAGNPMIVWDNNENNAQHWNVDQMGGGWCRMRNGLSNLCLDLASGSANPGTKIQQWYDNGQTPQRWMMERVNGSWNAFRLRNQASGTCARATGSAGGSAVVGDAWNGENNMQWWVDGAN